MSVCRLSFLFSLSLMISGCILTPGSQDPTADNYAAALETDWQSYYLWLKQQDIATLEFEIDRQQRLLAQGNKDSEMRLALLYSLPASPVKNPHRARTDLLRLTRENPQQQTAFITLLMDQLRENIHMQYKMDQAAQQYQTQLQQEQSLRQQLEQQLEQLKLIEQQINEREQR